MLIFFLQKVVYLFLKVKGFIRLIGHVLIKISVIHLMLNNHIDATTGGEEGSIIFVICFNIFSLTITESFINNKSKS